MSNLTGARIQLPSGTSGTGGSQVFFAGSVALALLCFSRRRALHDVDSLAAYPPAATPRQGPPLHQTGVAGGYDVEATPPPTADAVSSTSVEATPAATSAFDDGIASNVLSGQPSRGASSLTTNAFNIYSLADVEGHADGTRFTVDGSSHVLEVGAVVPPLNQLIDTPPSHSASFSISTVRSGNESDQQSSDRSVTMSSRSRTLSNSSDNNEGEDEEPRRAHLPCESPNPFKEAARKAINEPAPPTSGPGPGRTQSNGHADNATWKPLPERKPRRHSVGSRLHEPPTSPASKASPDRRRRRSSVTGVEHMQRQPSASPTNTVSPNRVSPHGRSRRRHSVGGTRDAHAMRGEQISKSFNSRRDQPPKRDLPASHSFNTRRDDPKTWEDREQDGDNSPTRERPGRMRRARRGSSSALGANAAQPSLFEEEDTSGNAASEMLTSGMESIPPAPGEAVEMAVAEASAADKEVDVQLSSDPPKPVEARVLEQDVETIFTSLELAWALHGNELRVRTQGLNTFNVAAFETEPCYLQLNETPDLTALVRPEHRLWMVGNQMLEVGETNQLAAYTIFHLGPERLRNFRARPKIDMSKMYKIAAWGDNDETAQGSKFVRMRILRKK